jgi:hypothetical protein
LLLGHGCEAAGATEDVRELIALLLGTPDFQKK